jgi:3-hydroxybutyryl-CoA dehydratase
MIDTTFDPSRSPGTGVGIGTQWVSAGRTITESDIVSFSGISGDFNLLHSNEDWVKRNTPFRGRIAHGMLIVSITTGLRTPGFDDLTVLAFLAVERQMKAPVYPGDTIRARFTVSALKPSASRPGSTVMTVTVEVLNLDDVPVQTGSDTYLIASLDLAA